MKQSIRTFDSLFSLFVFATIVMLAIYMAVRLSAGGYFLVQDVISGEFFSNEEFLNESSKMALHAIAEVLILIKAYRILVSYLKTHHISVEYIVEISIIAPAIELLFATAMYDTSTKIILGVFGVTNLFLYLYFFGAKHDMELHEHMRHESEHAS